MQGKHSINLLQPELLPDKSLLSLKRTVIIWFVTIGLMTIWAFYISQTQQSLTKNHLILQGENSIHTQLVEKLEAQLQNRRVDSALTEKLASVKLLMLNKKALYKELTDPSRTFVTGFAAAMTELASLHHKDISLQMVNINTQDMTFTGLARVPDAVPAWLAGFENSTLLSGKSFIYFKLVENKDKITEFVVSSKVNGASN